MGGDDEEKPYFPAARPEGAYRRAERVAPIEEPPKQTEVHLAEPPPSSTRAALRATGLSVEQRIARDRALHDEQATEVAKRAGWSLAVRLGGVAALFLVAGVISLLPRGVYTVVFAVLGVLGAGGGFVWRIRRALRQTRDREGNW